MLRSFLLFDRKWLNKALGRGEESEDVHLKLALDLLHRRGFKRPIGTVTGIIDVGMPTATSH